jgi:PAS domain S-box-containing protein
MQSRHRQKSDSARRTRREAIRPLSDQHVATPRSTFDPECEATGSEHDETRRFALGTREIVGIESHLTDDGDALMLARPSNNLELASIPHATFVIDAGGQIEYVNALAESLAGYTRTELQRQPIARIISDICATVAATRALEAHVRFVSADSGVCVHHRSGRELPVSVVLCPHGHGSVLALVTPVTGVDLDAEHASGVAEIVHDFKNPLATIALEMCLLDDKLEKDHGADLHPVVARVNRNIDFLDRMVQDLLDSCTITAGELSLQRRPTELRSLLEHVLERAVATCDRTRVVLSAPSPVTLVVDELRIQRVVANLLQNALKYAPRESAVVITLDVTASHARISVIDAGPGMVPDELAFIFDKYRRTARARRHEGSGLGLYVSKQIIEAHGGRIGVDSAHGIGSRFFFELPVTT